MSDTARLPDPNPTPDLVSLIWVRNICTSGPDEATQWQEGLIKRLTGGEPLEVRHLVGFCEEPGEFRLKISGRHASDSRDREQ